MSEDTKGFDAGDFNLFRYCNNDPEDRTDPMGLDPRISEDTNASSNGPGTLQSPEDKLRQSLKNWEERMAKRSDASTVEWKAKYNPVHDPNGTRWSHSQDD